MPDLERPGQIDDAEPGDLAGSPRVVLARVIPVVSHVVAVEAPEGPEPSPTGGGIDLDRVSATFRIGAGHLAVAGLALLVGAVAIAVTGDARLGLGGAATIAAVVAIRFIDRHVAFSFGEGFVGYRGDPAWPHGVQEDDDVRWDWRHRPAKATTEHRG